MLAAIALLLLAAACSRQDAASLIASAERRLEQDDVAGAVIHARNALAEDGRSALGRYTLARALLAAGDFRGAELELQRADELGYSPAAVAVLSAQILNAQGRHAELIDQLGSRSLDSRSDAAALATELAHAHAALRDRDGAERRLAAALAADPGHVPALLLGAELDASAGDREGALASIDGVIADDATHAGAWLTRAQLLARDPATAGQAEAAYRRALQNRPRLVAAHAGLAALLLDLGRRDALRAQVEAMAQAVPETGTTLYYQSALALLENDLLRARDGAQRLLRGAPDELRVVYLAGLVEARLGNRLLAESLQTRAIHMSPGAIGPRRELAALQVSAGHGDRALQTLSPALAVDVADAEIWRIVGRAHMNRGDFRAADIAFARAAQLGPDAPGLRLDVAQSLLVRGEIETGMRELELAAADDSGFDADLALVAVHMGRRDVGAALAAVDAMRRKAPDSPMADFVRGRILQASGDTAGASRSFEAALAIDPAHLPSISSLADMDLAEEQPARARQRYEALLRRDPQSAEAMLALAAITRREGGSRADTAGWLDRAVAAGPLDPQVWRRVIEHHRRDGDARGALARAQAAVATAGEDPLLMTELASTQIAASEVMQAVGTLNRLLTLMPNSPDAHLRLAQAQLLSGSASAARASVTRAAQLAPDWPPAIRAQFALALGVDRDVQRALALAQAVQERRPADPLGWVLQAEAESHRDQHAAAVRAYRTALAKRADGEVASALHRSLQAAGDDAGASKFAEDWLRAQPEDVALLLRLAETADNAGDLAAAERHYRELVARVPGEGRLINNLAYVLVRRDSGDALPMARRAAAIAPHRPEVLDTMAAALAARRQFAEAVDWQTRALQLSPADARMRLKLARYLIAADRKDRARIELQQLDRGGMSAQDRATTEQLLRQIGG